MLKVVIIEIECCTNDYIYYTYVLLYYRLYNLFDNPPISLWSSQGNRRIVKKTHSEGPGVRMEARPHLTVPTLEVSLMRDWPVSDMTPQ